MQFLKQSARFLKAAALLLGLAGPAFAGPYQGITLSTTTGKATENISGYLKMAANAAASTIYNIILEGDSGSIKASSGTFVYGVSAATFTATGGDNTHYSVDSSSGIRSQNGTILGHFIQATNGFFGNLVGNVVGNLTGNVTGNVTGTSSLATYLAGGAAGQFAYQTAAGVTGFTAAPGALGIVAGDGVGLSSATLTGTASQITITRTAAAITWALASTINVNISGNAATATAFASAPTPCLAQAATGVDVNGNAVGCFSAGTGDAVKASTQTFTGANAFWNVAVATNVSSGNQIITINSPHGIANGLEYSQVISTSGAWSSLMFAGLDANAEYELIIDSITTTAVADIFLRFGTSGTTADSTAGHYAYGLSVIHGGGTSNTDGAASNSACEFDDSASGIAIGYSGRFRATFHTGGGGPMMGYMQGTFRRNATSDFAWSGGYCQYNQTAAIVNVSILPSSGNFSGTFHLKRIL